MFSPVDDGRGDLQQLKARLGDHAEDLAVYLFGEPTRRTSRELRWGRSGKLLVRLRGKHGPSFRSWELPRGGSMLDAIMFRHGGGFDDAVRWARQWLGDDGAPSLPRPRLQANYDADQDEKERIDQAGRIWRSGRSIAGTVAEKYLHGRGLTDAWPLDAARFVPMQAIEKIAGWSWWRWPAVVFAARDDKGEIKAVQLVALNSDGTAAKRWDSDGKMKMSLGPQTGSAVRFAGDQDKPLLLAEGPETAASCWQATGWETWANLGTITKAPLDGIDKGRVVIVCADDDPRNAPTNKALRDAIRKWRKQGRTVLMIKPWDLTRGNKSDFNDLLKAEGFDAVRRRIEAVLPNAAPANALPSPLEARREMAAAMRSSFEALMAWQPGVDGEAAPFHAFKVGLGLGKTEQLIGQALDAVQAGRKVVLLTPRHDLNAEIEKRIEDEAGKKGAAVRVEIWRGREAMRPDYPGEPMCEQLELVREAQWVMADVKETVCKICPMRDGCPYLAQGEKQAEIWIAAHELMFTEMPAAMKGAGLLLIDEGFTLKAITGTNPLEPVAISLDALDIVPHVPKDVKGEKRVDLEAELMPLRHKLIEAMRNSGEGWISRQALIDAGLTAELAAQAYGLEWKAKVDVDVSDGTTMPGLRAALKAAAVNREIVRRGTMWRGIEAVLADESASKSGRIRIETQETKFGPVQVARIFGLKQIRQDWKTLPTINADATMDIDLLRHLVPHADRRAEIEAQTPHLRVRQVIGKTFGKRAIEHDAKLQIQVETFARLEAMKSGGDVLLITNKAVQGEIEKRARESQGRALPPFLKLAHFNDLAGSDQWREVSAAVIVGRPMPRPAEVELMAGILTGRAIEQTVPEGDWFPAATVTLAARSGQAVTVEADRHPDAMAERIRAAVCERELLQAIGRVRGVNRTAANPVEVILLGNVPVPGLVPDQLEQWAAPDADQRAFADTGVWLSSAADQARVAGLSPKALQKARQRQDQKETGPYKGYLYEIVSICSGLRRVAYRRLAERNGEHEAAFDPRLVGDIKAWLAERLGPVDCWEVETGEPVAEMAAVPIDPLAGYHGGRLDAVQADAARDRIRGSGLRQDEIARLVGVSRPQLANALQGRFGLSQDVAERLRAVLAHLPERQGSMRL